MLIKNTSEIKDFEILSSKYKIKFNYNKEKLNLIQLLRNMAKINKIDSKISNILSSINQNCDEYGVTTPQTPSSRNQATIDQKSSKINQMSTEYDNSSKDNSRLSKSRRSNSNSKQNFPSTKIIEFSNRITAQTKCSEMKTQIKPSLNDTEQVNRLQNNDIESCDSDDDSEHYTTPIISAGMKIEGQNIEITDFEKTAHISATQDLFTEESMITEKFIVNQLPSPNTGLKDPTINSDSLVDLNLDELREEKIEEQDRSVIKQEARNPIEILRKIKEVNTRRSVNLQLSETQQIIKDHYTINNFKTPLKEELKKKTNANKLSIYSKSNKDIVLQTPKAKTKSNLNSGDKISATKLK